MYFSYIILYELRRRLLLTKNLFSRERVRCSRNDAGRIHKGWKEKNKKQEKKKKEKGKFYGVPDRPSGIFEQCLK